MIWKLALFIVLTGDLVFLSLTSSVPKLSLYGKNEGPIEVLGSECSYGVAFEEAKEFSCACMIGLWAFYEDSCSAPKLITGSTEEKCISLNQKVKKVHLLSPPGGKGESAVVFTNGMKTTSTRLESEGKATAANVSSGELTVIATGKNSWGLSTKDSCFVPSSKTNSSQHCKYAYKAAAAASLQKTCKGPKSPSIASTECAPFIQGSIKCPTSKNATVAPEGRAIEAPKSAKAANKTTKGTTKATTSTTTTTTTTTETPKTTEEPTTTTTTTKAPAKAKPVEKVNSPAKGPQGRAFLDTIMSMGANNSIDLSNLTAYDENANITLNITYPEMNSEVWNYLTTKAQEILNLTAPVQPSLPSPTFKFLEISKKIIQKACPDTYVNDGHFDMALSTFINLQTKQYKFQDPFSDYGAAQRIEDSLKVCLDQIKLYPFVDATEFSKKNGTCNNTIEMGTYEAFDTWIELNLTNKLASRENEPIVETVWKIFTHAHAACFKYFEQSYNDHHRFTSVVMPVFSNDINGVWKSMDNVTKDTYSGLLGDAIKLMDGVAYCAEYSKLDTEYPWDLPRPEKDLTNIRVKRSAPNIRVKRAPADKPSFKCLKQSYENTCKG